MYFCKKIHIYNLKTTNNMEQDNNINLNEQESNNLNEQEIEGLEPVNEGNSSYKYVLYATTALVAAAALYVGWLYVSSDKDWGFQIEWAFWKSTTLWPILSVIGFFLQFFNWQHMSFDEGFLVKKPTGEKEFYRNDDILSFLMGHVLWPLISHFFLIPCAYGAVLYYLVMVPVALLNAVLPYLAAGLCILLIIYYFVIGKSFESKTTGKAYTFLSIATLLSLGLIWLLSLPTRPDFNFGDDNTASTQSYNSDSSAYNEEEPDCDTDDMYATEESNEEAINEVDTVDVSENISDEEPDENATEPSTAEETPAPAAEQPSAVQQAPSRPSRSVRQSSLLRANVASVSHNGRDLELNLTLRTPMVRRQLTLTGTSAIDEDNLPVSISKVELSGIDKERGRDYYIFTDQDTAYLTITFPDMPSSGFIKQVRVNMSLSGAREWVLIENLSW